MTRVWAFFWTRRVCLCSFKNWGWKECWNRKSCRASSESCTLRERNWRNKNFLTSKLKSKNSTNSISSKKLSTSSAKLKNFSSNFKNRRILLQICTMKKNTLLLRLMKNLMLIVLQKNFNITLTFGNWHLTGNM